MGKPGKYGNRRPSGGHAHGQPITGSSVLHLPGFRDRRVNVQTVVCPTCGAPVGEKCITSTGKHGRHNSRRVMALRLEREQNEKGVEL